MLVELRDRVSEVSIGPNHYIGKFFQPYECLTLPANWHKTYKIYAAESAKCANSLIIPVSTVTWIAVSPWVSQLCSHFHEGYSFQIIISTSFPRVCGLATFSSCIPFQWILWFYLFSQIAFVSKDFKLSFGKLWYITYKLKMHLFNSYNARLMRLTYS